MGWDIMGIHLYIWGCLMWVSLGELRSIWGVRGRRISKVAVLIRLFMYMGRNLGNRWYDCICRGGRCTVDLILRPSVCIARTPNKAHWSFIAVPGRILFPRPG
jgi:hypothetical protein